MGVASKLLEGLATLSPLIGSALGGPVGGLIGKGVGVAASMITGKTEPEDILKELTLNPEKLMELEQKANEMELEELRIHAADRDSARGMQTELAKVGHGSAWAAPLVSLVAVVGFFIMLYVVLEKEAIEISDVAFILLGSLAAGFTQVLNYWLGSSKSSSEKNALLSGRNN